MKTHFVFSYPEEGLENRIVMLYWKNNDFNIFLNSDKYTQLFVFSSSEST